MKAPSPFRRLSRSHSGLGSRVSLWAGPGQLVIVDDTAFSESYQRILFEDIETICVWPSSRQMHFRWIIPVGGLLVYLLLSLPLGLAGASWFWLLPLALLILNEARGPSVTVRLATRARRIDLDMVKRLSEFEKLIAALPTAATEGSPVAAEVATGRVSP